MNKFPKSPSFVPQFSPMEILEGGAFGGTAYNKTSKFLGLSRVLQHRIRDIAVNLWNNQEYDASVNKFTDTDAPMRRYDMDIPDYLRILTPDGWFQWYMLFFYNRSPMMTNEFRVTQWKQEVSTLMFYVKKACNAANKPITDLTVTDALVWRQHLFQFGWDSTVNPVGIIK